MGVPFINADNIAREVFGKDAELKGYEAAGLATTIREEALLEGKTFCFETVFSHHSKVDFIGKAKALGYEVIMVVLHVESTELNQARVAQRVSEGGHSVPTQKIIDRIPRALANIKKAIPLCDEVHLLDNSSIEAPLLTVATIDQGIATIHASPLPDWAASLLQTSKYKR